ncbi:MAG: LamG domain-containing protein [Candidatus Nanopelagicales bacterium]
MNRHPALGVAACAIALTAACGGQAPTAPPDQASSTPAYAWALDGDGTAEPGTQDLTFNGEHILSEDAVSFTGTGSAATAAPGPVDATADFTVSAWVSLSPSLVGAPFATAVSQLGTTAAAFYLGVAENEWAFSMKDADSNEPGHTIRAAAGTATSGADTWVHLVGVHNQQANQIELYVDGRPAARTAFSAPWLADGPLTIGRSQAHGAPADFWPGAIADVTIYTTPLTEAQVADLTDRTRPTGPPPTAPTSQSALAVVNGTFEYPYTPTESKRLEESFGPEAAAAGFPGKATVTVRFVDGQWQQYFTINDQIYTVNGAPEGDGGTYTINGDQIVLENGHSPAATFRWTLDEDRLSLALNDYSDEDGDAAMVRFVMEHDYTRTAP